MSYCTGQTILDLIGVRTANTTDQSAAVVAVRAQNAADELSNAINYRGRGPVVNATEAQILAAASSVQLSAYEGINALLGVYHELQQRGSEIDIKYLSIAAAHKEFLRAPFNWLQLGQLRALWDTNHPRYPIATHRPSTRSIAFSGTGDNNLSSAGIYTGQDSATFTIQLLSSTTYQWKKGTGNYSSPVTITGSAQTLGDGVTITIPAGTHVTADQWIITITVWASIVTVAGITPGWNSSNTDAMTVATLNRVLDWFTILVYCKAAIRYDHTDILDSAARRFGEAITNFGSAIVYQSKALREGKLSQPALNRINEALGLLQQICDGKLRQTFRGN